jgi:signal transduction histidine kinase
MAATAGCLGFSRRLKAKSRRIAQAKPTWTLVRGYPGLSEDHCKDLDIVNRSGEHLLDLIDKVLDVAKIEAGRVALENAPFDVSALVRDAVEMMQARTRAKSFELLVSASPGVPGFARSDAAKLPPDPPQPDWQRCEVH